MDANTNCMQDNRIAAMLQAASNVTGLPVADLEALIDSELETDYLLGYITAMLSNRMN